MGVATGGTTGGNPFFVRNFVVPKEENAPRRRAL